MLAAARAFAPEGLDAALLTAGGETAERMPGAPERRPRGISERHRPAPEDRPGIRLDSYNGEPDAEIIGRLNRLIEAGPFEVEIDRTFPLAQAAEAQRALAEHHLGKIALRVR